MKRSLSLILALLLLTGLFTGCKNQAAPVPTEPSAAPSVPAETPTDPTLPPLQLDPRFESLAQEAVVKTALAFLNRGKYIQYDDTRFNPNVQIYRWEVGLKSPEDYNRQLTGYTNCAAFTYDVYKEALNYDIGAYTTALLTAKGTSMRRYTYIPTGKETAEEKAAVEADFRANLEIGDIIVVRYNGDREGNGHAMLYVGKEVLENGKDIIHSTGGNYSYKNFSDYTEPGGTVQTMSTNSLFSSSSGMYVFSKIKSLCLIRPLRTFKGSVPEKTCYRIQNLDGIVAEKLSSHTRGMTVNPGDVMTFHFAVSNKNDTPVTLEIRDCAPSNTTYLTGAEAVTGSILSWKVTVPAKGSVTVGYTVQVNTDAAYGDTVYSDAGTVGGVDVNCPKVYIAKTLTAEQQAAILTAAKEITGKTGMALADAIYEKALGISTGSPSDFAALDNTFFQTFTESQSRLQGTGGSLNMIPAGMFGGRKVVHRPFTTDYSRLEAVRTRLPQASELIAGDIILAVGGPDSAAGNGQHLFLYTDGELLVLNTGYTHNANLLLNTLLGYDRFVVIRPSMGM